MSMAAADAAVAVVPVAASAVLVAAADAAVAAILLLDCIYCWGQQLSILQSPFPPLVFRFYIDFLIQNSQRKSQPNFLIMKNTASLISISAQVMHVRSDPGKVIHASPLLICTPPRDRSSI
jgi:hypothetical protein